MVTAVYGWARYKLSPDWNQGFRKWYEWRRLNQKIYDFQLFSGLSQEAVDRLLQGMERRRFRKGEPLMRQGQKRENAYLLLEGRVGIQSEGKDGMTSTAIFYQAPYFLGHLELWKDRPGLVTVVAMEKCEALEITKKQYLALLQNNHQISINMVKFLSNLVYETYRLNQVRMFGKVDNLIANTLCSFARLYGEEHEYGVLIQRPISKSELADILGIARRSVIKAIADLEKEGLIQVSGKEVVISSLANLQQRAFTPVV